MEGEGGRKKEGGREKKGREGGKERKGREGKVGRERDAKITLQCLHIRRKPVIMDSHKSGLLIGYNSFKKRYNY